MPVPVKKEVEVAAIVDDSGRIQAKFGGQGAKQEAQSFLMDALKGGVKHLRGATVLSGPEARKAIENGRV